MIEVTADGVTFSSLGLGVKKHNIPILPDTEDYNTKIAGRDGEVDFGSVYGPRVFDIECVLMANDTGPDYHTKIAAIASVFNAKKGDIIFTFSDIENKRYVGRYSGTMPIEKLLFDGNVTIPIKMHDPFPESLRDTSVIEYDQGLEYGQGYEYSFYSVAITSGSQSFTMENEGTVPVEPIITITGKFTNLSLSDGENTFTFTGSNIAADVLEIDCRLNKATVKKNGVNAYASSNGVFFTLQPGNTTFTAASTSPDFAISFVFRNKYLY